MEHKHMQRWAFLGIRNRHPHPWRHTPWWLVVGEQREREPFCSKLCQIRNGWVRPCAVTDSELGVSHKVVEDLEEVSQRILI